MINSIVNTKNIRPIVITSIIFISILTTYMICQDVYAASTFDSIQDTNRQNTGIFVIITDEFINNTEVWIVKLEKYVKDIFVLLFNFEIAVLGIRALINRKSLEDIFGELIMAAVVGGVIYTCIMNYSEWSNSIINGISKYAGLLNNTDINTFDSIHKGFEIFKAIITASAGPIDRIVFFLCGVIIFICFALINIQIIYIKCEASVAVSAAFILLGFGGCSIFRDYAMNLMRYIISVGFKLFVMYAVLGLGFGFIQNKWL